MSTEYPESTRRYFEKKGIEADIRLSYGATEAKVPDIVDCIVEITETGRALRAAGLKIVDEILQSYTELVANPAAYADDAKRHAMEQVRTLLDGALEARGKVLVKLNVGRDDLDRVIALVPSMKAPDGVRAVRPGRLRGRDGRGQVRDQHADPGAQGRRRRPTSSSCRSPRSSTEVTARSRTSTGRRGVAAFDEARGLGTIAADDGTELLFHCTAIADGTRTIAVGRPVRFVVVAGRLGRWEAADIVTPSGPDGRR